MTKAFDVFLIIAAAIIFCIGFKGLQFNVSNAKTVSGIAHDQNQIKTTISSVKKEKNYGSEIVVTGNDAYNDILSMDSSIDITLDSRKLETMTISGIPLLTFARETNPKALSEMITRNGNYQKKIVLDSSGKMSRIIYTVS